MHIVIGMLRALGQVIGWFANFCFGSLMRFAITATVMPALIGIYVPSGREMANAAISPAILLLATLLWLKWVQGGKSKKRKRKG